MHFILQYLDATAKFRTTLFAKQIGIKTLFPTWPAIYIDKVKGDEAVLSQAYSWGTPIHRDYSSLPKVTHRKSVAELGNETRASQAWANTPSKGQYLKWNVSTHICTGFRKLLGLLRNCRNGIICASVTLTLWIRHVSLSVLPRPFWKNMKLECWVLYAIPYHVLCIPRKPASHCSACLLYVLLPSRVGLLGTAALAQPRRPDYLVPAPASPFSPALQLMDTAAFLICSVTVSSTLVFVCDTSDTTIENPGHSLGSHAAYLPGQGNA